MEDHTSKNLRRKEQYISVIGELENLSDPLLFPEYFCILSLFLNPQHLFKQNVSLIILIVACIGFIYLCSKRLLLVNFMKS